MGASSKSVALAFAMNIGLTLGFFALFSWLRLTAFARRFYAPKRFDATVQNKPRRLPPGVLAWIRTIMSYPETEVIKSAGLDSAMYIRVLSLGWEVFAKVSIVTIFIILPINLSGTRISMLLDQQTQSSPPPSPPPPAGCGFAPDSISANTDKYSFTSFDACSLANIPPGSPKFWAQVVIQWVVTFIVITTLYRFNREATLLRLAFLANAPRGGPSHTVLITDIPGIKYGTLLWYLRGLVGSTLFILLPAKIKRKVLDSFETGVSNVMHLDVGGAVGNVLQHTGVVVKATDWAEEPVAQVQDVKPPLLDALSATAVRNSRLAELKEDAKRKSTTGIIQRKRTTPDVLASDPRLDPWKQAEQVLGDALEPRADKVQDFIHSEVEFAYGKGCVAAVNPVWDQSALNPVLSELEALKQKLEDRVDMLASKLKRRKKLPKPLKLTIVGPTLGAWGMEKYGMKPVQVDALDYWPQRIAHLSSIVPKLQEQCRSKAIPAAFVTLESRHTQAIMTTTLHHHDETTWQIQGAPEPKEIIWGSLALRRWERSLRTLVMWAAYFVLLCFYMIPIAAVQALIEVPKLASVPVLGTIVNLPFIKQVIEGILPGLILVVFLALLPLLLALMCRMSGFVSDSQVDYGVVVRFFYFQVAALFLGSIIAGSVFNQIKQLFSNPKSILNILGVAIPVTSTFFINFVLVAGVGKTGFKHMRIPQLAIFWLLSKVAATPRARARLWADQFICYGPEVPNHSMIFFLGLTYCCINPIISPVCLLYYSFTVISARYNSLYVFKRTYESGGRLWLYVFNQAMLALYVMQIIMIILLSLKEFKPVFLLIPLPFITFTFHMATLNLFQRPWTVMSAHDAAQLDRMDATERKGQAPMTYQELQLIRDMYLSPTLKVRPEDVDDLLRETEVIKRRIAGEKLEDIEAEMDEQGWVSAEEELDPEDSTLTSSPSRRASLPSPATSNGASSGARGGNSGTGSDEDDEGPSPRKIQAKRRGYGGSKDQVDIVRRGGGSTREGTGMVVPAVIAGAAATSSPQAQTVFFSAATTNTTSSGGGPVARVTQPASRAGGTAGPQSPRASNPCAATSASSSPQLVGGSRRGASLPLRSASVAGNVV